MIRAVYGRPGDGMRLECGLPLGSLGFIGAERVCPCTALALAVRPARSIPVKGRAPGSSEQLHRSGERRHGRSEPLMAPQQNSLRVIGAGEALSPRPSDSLAKGGIVRAEPLRLCSSGCVPRAQPLAPGGPP